MGLVTNAIRDHSAKELSELREKRRAFLEKAAELGREIATIEALEILSAEHQEAEGHANSKPDAKASRESGACV